MPSLHGWLLRYDLNKYIHIVLLHDQLHWLEEQGLTSFLQYPEPLRANLEGYLTDAARRCQQWPDCREGMTMIVMGGLGRGFGLGLQGWPDGWGLSVIRLPDLLMLASQVDRPVDYYLKCMKQRDWAENEGFLIHNVNGDFNLYCYWCEQEYFLIPHNMTVQKGNEISIGTDWVFPVRKRLRNLNDQHLVLDTSGSPTPVMRTGRDAYFQTMRDRPIYVSLSQLQEKVLAGVVESPRGASWLTVEPQEADETMLRLTFDMWSGFIDLYERLVAEIEGLLPEQLTGPVEVRLDLRCLAIPEQYNEAAPAPPITESNVVIDHARHRATVKPPAAFLVHFQQPTNTGEELLLRSMAYGLAKLHCGPHSDADMATVAEAVQKVLSSPGMRILHLFHTYSPVEHFVETHVQQPTFLAYEDLAFAQLRLSYGCASPTRKLIGNKSECNEFLKRVVDKVWREIRDLLVHLSRDSLLQQAISIHEAVIQDRSQWRRTAQALVALYGSPEDVSATAQDREGKRTDIALAARTIMEMAVCECPQSGGREPSRWELDELLARAALLIRVAADSDAIYHDLVEPQAILHENGTYSVGHEFRDSVIRPFATNYYRELFESDVLNYASLYQRTPPSERRDVVELFPSGFEHAFVAEFGLTPTQALDGLTELFDIAVGQDKIVVETTVGLVRKRLQSNLGFSTDESEAMLRMFGLFHRPRWDQPPKGFVRKDLYPWRFRRRLSATVRPVLIFGHADSDRLMYGVGSLFQGAAYLLDRINTGQLPSDFFRSSEMRSYIGSINDSRGREFTSAVAMELNGHGWETCTERPMTEFGAPEQYGDLDVLAWKASGEVLLVEAKRLQFARTVVEVAEVCQRFRGEAQDQLARHLRRVAWIREHPEHLAPVVGFVPDASQVEAKLVTNTHVPMMYLHNLPMDPGDIVPFNQLQSLDKSV